MSRVRDGRSGGSVVSTMEDVVELRDGIATFDAYWHNASGKNLHMILIVANWCKSMDQCCREMSTLQINFEGRNPNNWILRSQSSSSFIHIFIGVCLFERSVSHDSGFKRQPRVGVREIGDLVAW